MRFSAGLPADEASGALLRCVDTVLVRNTYQSVTDLTPRPAPIPHHADARTLRNVRLMRTPPANGCSPSFSAGTPW